MTIMKRLILLVSTVLTAIIVAATYHYFESAVHYSTNLVWNTWLKTGTNRMLVVPLCIGLTLLFFGVQHLLDRKSEKEVSEGLGQVPDATILNFAKVITIGFFSLLAGASLGPEAILVPACMVIGAYIGTKLFPNQKEIIRLLSALGFVALFAAFFDSFIAGMLGLLLIGKQTKAKLTLPLILFSALASYTTVFMLNILEGSAYMEFPTHVAAPDMASVLAVVGLLVAGVGITGLLKLTHDLFERDFAFVKEGPWWGRAMLAGAGLAALYLFGGPLVQFTGNQSIAPLLQQAATLGLGGLLWIIGIKILAIAWSKALGYRGGLVFPSVFVASAAVALAQLYVSNLSFMVGLIAVMVGIIAADTKAKVLF